MTAPIYDRVALIGLGLIASSMGHAMKAAGLAGTIAGHAKTRATREAALELGFCDEVFATASRKVAATIYRDGVLTGTAVALLAAASSLWR